MTLLSTVQNVAAIFGMVQPQAIAGDPNETAQQWMALANNAQFDIFQRSGWQTQRDYQFFTSTPNQFPQNDALPADFGRMIPETFWDLTRRIRLNGPINSMQWSALQTGIVVTVYPVWRLLAGKLNIFPAPGIGFNYLFEYVSKNSVHSAADVSAGGDKPYFTADDDFISAFPEKLLELSMIYRFRKFKGLSYAEEMEDFERALEMLAGEDTTLKEVYTSGQSLPYEDSYFTIPGPILPGTVG